MGPAHQLSVTSTQGTISVCHKIPGDFVFGHGCSSWNWPVVAGDPFATMLIGSPFLMMAG